MVWQNLTYDQRTMGPTLDLIRTVIVDDEPPARERLIHLLQAEEDIAIVAQCGSGTQAITAIEEHLPDLVLLDVQLPGIDGFGVIAEVRMRHPFHVIFVTAHDEHAVRAFDVSALDFLLKPFDSERLHRALQRVRDRRHEPGRIVSGPDGNTPHPVEWDRIAVREHNRVIFLRPAEIDWVEAEGNYVRLHVGRETHLLRETMRAAEERLGPRGFLRISRSTLVNLERVHELQPLFHGDSVLMLHDGRKLAATRAYRAQLDEILVRLG